MIKNGFQSTQAFKRGEKKNTRKNRKKIGDKSANYKLKGGKGTTEWSSMNSHSRITHRLTK